MKLSILPALPSSPHPEAPDVVSPRTASSPLRKVVSASRFVRELRGQTPAAPAASLAQGSSCPLPTVEKSSSVGDGASTIRSTSTRRLRYSLSLHRLRSSSSASSVHRAELGGATSPSSTPHGEQAHGVKTEDPSRSSASSPAVSDSWSRCTLARRPSRAAARHHLPSCVAEDSKEHENEASLNCASLAVKPHKHQGEASRVNSYHSADSVLLARPYSFLRGYAARRPESVACAGDGVRRGSTSALVGTAESARVDWPSRPPARWTRQSRGSLSRTASEESFRCRGLRNAYEPSVQPTKHRDGTLHGSWEGTRSAGERPGQNFLAPTEATEAYINDESASPSSSSPLSSALAAWTLVTSQHGAASNWDVLAPERPPRPAAALTVDTPSALSISAFSTATSEDHEVTSTDDEADDDEEDLDAVAEGVVGHQQFRYAETRRVSKDVPPPSHAHDLHAKPDATRAPAWPDAARCFGIRPPTPPTCLRLSLLAHGTAASRLRLGRALPQALYVRSGASLLEVKELLVERLALAGLDGCRPRDVELSTSVATSPPERGSPSSQARLRADAGSHRVLVDNGALVFEEGLQEGDTLMVALRVPYCPTYF